MSRCSRVKKDQRFYNFVDRICFNHVFVFRNYKRQSSTLEINQQLKMDQRVGIILDEHFLFITSVKN